MMRNGSVHVKCLRGLTGHSECPLFAGIVTEIFGGGMLNVEMDQ